MRVRVGVKPDNQDLSDRKLSGKDYSTPKIPSESLCLDSCPPRFTQLSLDFK